ncbi:hypothetical protein POM88_026157 [Heracleum sosnowskyi]|uniref:Replication protein A 70 kDa DNA-binding subunit B/D first OB fold domain-containing protein n=1 Tax=Heracleum sosnowskyi TaxID=360622 RepID=A0AAD8MPP8_9APIA|nr:hypothetical protein POM88_026157 [Heracleum sosnowskyi]
MWLTINGNGGDIVRYNLILLDCENTQMHAIVSPEIWQLFPNEIEEGSLCNITNLHVGPAFGQYRPVTHTQKMMSFMITTIVNVLPEDFVIPMHKFELVEIQDLHEHAADSIGDEKAQYSKG